MEGGLTFVNVGLFFGTFLAVIAFLKVFTKHISFPYTVALLLLGFATRIIVDNTSADVALDLPPDLMYFLLLPLLLFESAYHVNFHQFRLQFKTISFLSTFGLLISVTVIGAGLFFLLDMPLEMALLFGAIISATDPIAVLSLFKNLGGPKRLALLADGESMFNDATAVILFRLLLGLALVDGNYALQQFGLGLLEFAYVFAGSIAVGAALGYGTGLLINQVFEERVVETTLTVALALGGFILTEHYMGLSGVIATVMSGLVLGNVGKTKFSGSVIKFMEELWEYIGFLAVSLIFFFAAFDFDWSILNADSSDLWIIIAVVLVARAVSVYATFFITNRSSFFRNEPNVPLKWQHILNWGGLKGVIPLVLVYSLPSEIDYAEELQRFTLATLLFSLFINGITIKWLLMRLKLHLPNEEEEIIREEKKIFEIEEARARLKHLPRGEFDKGIILESDTALGVEEERHRKLLLKLATPKKLLRSLRLQAISIERKRADELFHEGHIDEGVYYDFQGELDLQQDAIEYPDVYKGRAYDSGGKVNKRESFRLRMERFAELIQNYPLFRFFLRRSKNRMIELRYNILKTRIIASTSVFEHLDHVTQCMIKHLSAVQAIDQVRQEHKRMYRENKKQLAHMRRRYPSVAMSYQHNVIQKVVCKEKISLRPMGAHGEDFAI